MSDLQASTIVGFNVYRSATRAGGYTQLNDQPVSSTAVAVAQGKTRYTFVDRSPSQSQPFYTVEAVTADGYGEIASPVGVTYYIFVPMIRR